VNDSCTYLIQLRGQVDNGEINARSPLQMTVVRADLEATLLSVGTDQSGLIGLIRHLHGLGFVLLSVSRVETKGEPTDQTSP
jgi:hypothetical protein